MDKKKERFDSMSNKNLKNKRFLWEKIDNDRYIRSFIHFNVNLHTYEIVDTYYNNSDDEEDNDIIFKVNNEIVNDYLSSKVLPSPFENIIQCDSSSSSYLKEEKKRDFLDNDSFKYYYVKLIKCLYAVEIFSNNSISLLLSDIFNLCNVVAFNLKQKFIVILYNQQIYVIFYARKNRYITLDLRGKTIKDHYDIQREIKEFLCHSDMNYIYDYYTVNLDKGSSSSSFSSFFSKIINTIMSIINYLSPPSLIVSSPPKLPLIPPWLLHLSPFEKKQEKKNIEKELIKNCLNEEEDLLMEYFDWKWNKETKTYSRYCINFQFSLKDIYQNAFKKENKYAHYSLADVCENLLRFNHLYVFHEALIYNNVIHIDFENYSFVILNVLDRYQCEVMTISFLPLYYKGKSSNELIYPFSNYVLKLLPFTKLYFNEYLPQVNKKCNNLL